MLVVSVLLIIFKLLVNSELWAGLFSCSKTSPLSELSLRVLDCYTSVSTSASTIKYLLRSTQLASLRPPSRFQYPEKVIRKPMSSHLTMRFLPMPRSEAPSASLESWSHPSDSSKLAIRSTFMKRLVTFLQINALSTLKKLEISIELPQTDRTSEY